MKIFCIGDIHFGKRKNTESLYNELKNSFLNKIKENGADLVVLLGDMTDTKLQLNSEAAMYYNRFMDDLHRLALEFNFLIFCINGTFSHERNQLKAFSHFFNFNMRYFDKPSYYRYKNMDFLLLPEEYMRNEEEEKRIQELLDRNYDFVFGHGMFEHVGPAAIQCGSTKTRTCWNYKQFENNVKYFVVFGHIHIGSKYKNIIYPGSFSREAFGEEEDKGFYYFEIKNNKLIKAEKIINIYAPKFKYIYYDYLPDDLDKLLIELKKEADNNEYIKIVINDKIDEEKYNNILGFVKNTKNSSIINKLPKKLSLKNLNSTEEEKSSIYIEKLKKYRGMDFIEITKAVAKDLYNEDFTTEEINESIKGE